MIKMSKNQSFDKLKFTGEINWGQKAQIYYMV